MPEQYASKSGEAFYLVTQAELEAAPGWRHTHGGRKGRGACVMHGGDNVTAMEADFTTGDVSCHTRGCYGRIAEHPDTKAGKPSSTARLLVNGRPATARRPPAATPPSPPPAAPPREPNPADLAALRVKLAGFAARLPGSRGEQYLRERGFALDVATACGIGWCDTGRMAGRVVFPLTDADGNATSATGRDTTGQDAPRYDTLPASAYPKTWFNGRAATLAAADGLPVYLCEGPLDALALLAGGITTALAVLGTSGVRFERLARAGVRRVVVCFDDDDAGAKGRADIAFGEAAALGVAVELMPAAILGGCDDLGEFWKAHGRLPDELLAHWQAAQEPPTPTPDVEPAGTEHVLAAADGLPDRNEMFASKRADLTCPVALREQAATTALRAAHLGVVSYAHLEEDVRAAGLQGDEQAFWRAVLAEAHELRRQRCPACRRCRACDAELIGELPCRICRGWNRPESVVGLTWASLRDALARADADEPLPDANTGP